jgi:hypothetical protein
MESILMAYSSLDILLNWTYLQVKGVEEVKDEDVENEEKKESWSCSETKYMSTFGTVLSTWRALHQNARF